MPSRALACESFRPITLSKIRLSESAASIAPPGNTYAPPRNAALCVRWIMSTSGPCAPGRRRIRVAAGRGVCAIASGPRLRRPAGAVFVVLRLDHGARFVPVGVAHLVELQEIA